ncbi:hypothetical protein ASPZODRAFT_112683 [Penicilliopsis zonata CBS 506.65]|uniref:Uncharacterized protein n=1 Tax=Penicilliopsis zonata CBS 506.65 TaxID=1073090 RepID=A0A1L9SM09_9EURO|nr:hypothetical protein ASPZODRAFT_112683 [Penicilliopsis zonata CBS 506.65]OJJ48131.1 hypothetical protein ASPZODRAFT_112683 [Penicilliopsis zonata CBS 506.65]
MAFAKSGISNLSLLDLDFDALDKVRGEIKAQHPDVAVMILVVDVTDEKAVEDGVRQTVQQFGRLDIAVNAAGIRDPTIDTHEVPQDAWQRVISINQTGCWLSERAEIQQMLQQESRGSRYGRGVIINVASALGLSAPATGIPFAPYVSAKHAVMGFTKADAKRYAPQGIRINAICPGWIYTPMIDEDVKSGILDTEVQSAAVGRIGQVEEVADAILFLASPMSSFVYGTGLVVDGGYTL